MLQLFEKEQENKIPTLLPEEVSLAMAYVPFQQNSQMVAAEEGFERGTIFADLYKPFTGKRGVLK
ncbi:MAG: spore coat associated protein CotJA [Clostridia bacterium]|nr:spore coat associated protein CotJA [Clostridia bacterium]